MLEFVIRCFRPVGAAILCILAAALSSCAHRDAAVSNPPSAPASAVALTPVPAPPATRPAPYECRWTDRPITIDGRADEEAWKHAVTIENFIIPGLGKPHMATRAKLLWDREYLYFFADMDDTDLYADVTEHQGAIWMNDAFELFFKPDDQKPGYYEFEVSPANTTLELFFPARNGGGYDRFKRETKIQMQTAVSLRGTLNHWQDTDQGWAVEGRIRWRDFALTGGRPNAGEEWKFALCRVDQSVGLNSPELSSHAPLTQVNFHRYEDYATVRFAGPESAASAASYGIDRRTPLTTSRVIGYPEPRPPYIAVKAFPKLKVYQPLYILEEPGTNNYLLLQHLGVWAGPGRLLRFKNDPNVDSAETVLDLNRIAYGMTFHPDYLHNHYLYLMSNGPVEAVNKQDRISRFTVDANGHVDPKSELVLLEWHSNGHNGGDLSFGPDGFLYCAAGDGSSDSDADLRGQDITHLNSGMIRIDVDHPDAGKPYSSPADNPFRAIPDARPELWAYGFRNPWRLAFDRKNGNLWVGQNGQDLWEQVYLVHRGENYGWSVFEGSHPFNLTRQRGPTPIVMPTVEHSHSEMRSLTGGVVYYGSRFPELQGAFVYGDWSTGRIWGVKHDGKQVSWHKELARTPMQIVGFRETTSGDLLVIDQGTGIYRLEPAPKDAPTPPFPRKLSETGLFAATRDDAPAPGLIPYDVNSPLWSDGALKERFIALPGDSTMDVTTSRGWNFSEGAVLVKTFSLEMEMGKPASKRRIETRLFTKQMGQWAGYSYIWNEEQSDATLVEAAGIDRDYEIQDANAAGGTRRQTWHYPSRAECMTCHSRASNFVLGLSTLQMNKEHDYNGVKDSQLRTLEHLGVLRQDYMSFVRERIRQELLDSGKPDQEADQLMWKAVETNQQREPKPSTLLAFDPDHTQRLPDPYDAHADLNQRARSYLHANCAICHVEAGGGNALMNLEYTVKPEKMRVFDIPPQHARFDLPDAKIIASGSPESSVLFHRVSIRGPGQMPQLATHEVDQQAVKLLHDWISQSRNAN